MFYFTRITYTDRTFHTAARSGSEIGIRYLQSFVFVIELNRFDNLARFVQNTNLALTESLARSCVVDCLALTVGADETGSTPGISNTFQPPRAGFTWMIFIRIRLVFRSMPTLAGLRVGSWQDDHVRSTCARVAGALEEDRNSFQRRFYPAFLGSPHRVSRSHGARPSFICYEIFRLY
jgi:hypothetical protein